MTLFPGVKLPIKHSPGLHASGLTLSSVNLTRQGFRGTCFMGRIFSYERKEAEEDENRGRHLQYAEQVKIEGG